MYHSAFSQADPARLEDAWKSAICAGNTAFAENQFAAALDSYRHAFSFASRLIRRRRGCRSLGIPFVPIYLISCSNLGNTFAETRRLREAESWFLRALHFASIEYEPGSGGSDLRMAILNYCDFCDRTDREPGDSVMQAAIRTALGEGAGLPVFSQAGG